MVSLNGPAASSYALLGRNLVIMPSTGSGALPILDFSAFHGSDAQARAQLVADINNACRDMGFFQLTNTSISRDMQDRILAAAKEFFDLPIDEKMKCDLRSNKYSRGYERLGIQMLEPGASPDKKEAIYFGEDLPEDHPRVLAGEFNCGPNLYPPSLGQPFRDICAEYYKAALALSQDIMKALALGLGLAPTWFDEFIHVNPSAILRLIHYPPTPTLEENGRGAGAHRDFGCITILLQDGVGGLQVQDERTGQWLDVAPVAGAFVVNVGNAMMRWTNHHYTSNMHRVMNYSAHDRYSVPFFFSGNPKHVISTITGCETRRDTSDRKYGPPLTEAAYQPIVLQDYLSEQFTESYARVQPLPTIREYPGLVEKQNNGLGTRKRPSKNSLRGVYAAEGEMLQDNPMRNMHSEASDGVGEQDSCRPEVPGPSVPQGLPVTSSTTHATAQATTTLPDSTLSDLQYLRQRVRELESRVWQISTDGENSVPHVLSPGNTEASITALPAAYRATKSPCATEGGQTPHQDPNALDSETATDSEGENDASGVDGNDGSSVAPNDKQPRDTSDTVIKDAASILEFLAWGRRKDPACHPSGRRTGGAVITSVLQHDVSIDTMGSNNATGDDAGGPVTTNRPILQVPLHGTNGTAAFGDVNQSPGSGHDGLLSGGGGGGLFKDSESLQHQPLAVLQLLLPSRRQVEQLVHYHIECLLWYHASFFAPQFRADLADFYEKHHGSIERRTLTGVTRAGVDLQWAALLFSVLAGSLTCASDQQALAWGFSEPERHVLCKHWFQAALECLNRDQYMANHSIFSCQAIATMTISAHILGFSNTQSIQLAVAVRIAQSLGLHQLGVRGAVPADAEMGRRVWSQLCTQDWFGIPFSESYLVNPLHSQPCTLANCHDDDLANPLPEHEPTVSGYSRFLYTIASIMPCLQDGLLSCNTAYTRYQQVLSWDAHMRTLAMAKRPQFLSSQVALQPHWPCWIPWARRALAISSGHKIIMIHRSFLSESFTNPAFSFTRHTCIAASKTIIKEYKAVQREDGPTLWVHQAFSVAASIILLLDVLHRRPGEEFQHGAHKQLVEDVVDILQRFPNSMIAVRGIKVLRALLDELAAAQEIRDTSSPRTGRKRKRHGPNALSGDDAPPADPLGDHPTAQGTGFNVPAFIRRYCQSETVGGQRQPHQGQQAKQPSQTLHSRQHQWNNRVGQTLSDGAENNVSSEVTIGGDSPVRSHATMHGHVQQNDRPMGTENIPQRCATQSDDPENTGGLMEPDQLDVSRLLPLGWDSSSNGFENLLYLVNHDLVLP